MRGNLGGTPPIKVAGPKVAGGGLAEGMPAMTGNNALISFLKIWMFYYYLRNGCFFEAQICIYTYILLSESDRNSDTSLQSRFLGEPPFQIRL